MRHGTYHIAVGIWTINDKNEILLTLRAHEKPDWPDMWENTAGSVISGETSRLGAVRELFEETGIKVREDELFLLGTERGRTVIGDCYIVRKNIDLKDIVFQKGETCNAKWVTLSELDRMIAEKKVAPPVSSRLAKIRKKFEDFLYGRIGGEASPSEKMKKIPFVSADILLPKKDFDKWSVVACDQYTSEPEYWKKTDELVGELPSALRITLPEVYLNDGDVEERIEKINLTMREYIEGGVFEEYKNTMIYTERTLANGKVRRGIVGAIDLLDYDYREGSTSMVRATEGTVLSRIPPRVKIRENAPLELPHIMILIDDPDNTVIPSVADGKVVYDTPLMQNGGHIKGSLLDEQEIKRVTSALEALVGDRENPLLFAVGDGNHSLATAKACVDEKNPLSRYALAEIVNIHDTSLDFEPIYRVVFGVEPSEMIEAAKKRFCGCSEHKVECVYCDGTAGFSVDGLTAGVLQSFIDEYISGIPGAECDYIHGDDSVRKLCSEEKALGFIFDGIGKSELFNYVEKCGSLPRKTFSMGEANDKRYYMECRKIK